MLMSMHLITHAHVPYLMETSLCLGSRGTAHGEPKETRARTRKVAEYSEVRTCMATLWVGQGVLNQVLEACAKLGISSGGECNRCRLTKDFLREQLHQYLHKGAIEAVIYNFMKCKFMS